MEQEILSVSAASRRPATVAVAPSPTLDLLYSVFHLAGLRNRRSDAAEWAVALFEDHPDLAVSATALGKSRTEPGPMLAAFALAVEGGYVWDDEPTRLLHDLPSLASSLEARLASDQHPTLPTEQREWLLDPANRGWPEQIAATLIELWTAVEPYWTSQGRAAAEQAAAQVLERFESDGDVLRALPSHHFAQFESLAAMIRSRAEHGTLWIVPLALASGGGFHLEFERAAALGFGLLAEDVHAKTEQRVHAVARRAKALADPTRLMLLSLLARYPGTRLTVGDLARQLNVSQPTVSGHLKTLREAGLIRVERKGNRSLPTVEEEAIRELQDALDAVLHRSTPS